MGDKERALVNDRRALAVGAFILMISLAFIDDDSRAFDLISNSASALMGGVLGLLREAAEEDTYDNSRYK